MDSDHSSDNEEKIFESEEEEEQRIIEVAFGEVAQVVKSSPTEYDLYFHEPNQVLIEEPGVYDFEEIDGIIVLEDPKFFIPFCEELKERFPQLTGTTFVTNLEGGGQLTI